ncbi:hypothetical protein VCHA53O466_140133 [Vibrio chagasii]|nr:hypothetical protein VCHA53O466_140133 [Vibrio chagasii]
MTDYVKITLETKNAAIDEIIAKLTGTCDNKVVSKSTDGSIIITLHNKGERPTRYTAQVRTCQWGNLQDVVIDTIINKKAPEHQMLKVKWNLPKQQHNAVNVLNRLIAQDCDGSVEETNLNYKPIGLLYTNR